MFVTTSKGENESNIHYWLKIIQSYGGGSPVLVVTNKCEAHHLELNENRLTKDYAPNVQGFFNVSCEKGTGIKKLRKAIENYVNALPHVYDEVPESYFNVKAELEAQAESEDFIDAKEYRKLCRKHSLTEKQDQQILIRFLHDLGNVLNFDDPDNPYGLSDTNILNPEWVTGGVYKIINNIDLVRAQGVLKPSQLSTILDDHDRYPPERHIFIIGMMRIALVRHHQQRREREQHPLLAQDHPELRRRLARAGGDEQVRGASSGTQ